MFRNVSLALKITTGFGMIILGLVALGSVGFFYIGKVQSSVADLSLTHVPLLETTSAIDGAVGDQMYAVAMFALHKDNSYLKKMEDSKRIADQKFNKTKALISKDQDLVNEGWLAPLEKIERQHDVFAKACNAQIDAIKAGRPQAEIDSLEDRVQAEGASLMSLVDAFKAKNKKEANRVSEMADAVTSRARNWIAVIALVMTAAASVVAWLLTLTISRPIKLATNEIGIGTEQIESAAGQVAAASQTLAEGASEQASSIEETSSSLEELAAMTKQNSANALQADTLMNDSKQIVAKANGSMDKLTVSMTEISKVSQETSRIIKTIDEIAFQTNLLALNAAVEAARAGEAGAGFAVVADEVRNLAMRAAEAAKNTAELIEDSVRKIGEGENLVQSTSDAFTEVADSVDKVGELVAEIAAASTEQTQGVGQINQAVAEMDKVVQNNAANAEESASASEELSAQSAQINASVARLQTLVTGRRADYGSAALLKRLSPEKKPSDWSRLKSAQPKSVSATSPKALIPLEDNDFQDF